MSKPEAEPAPTTSLSDAQDAMHKGRAGSLVVMGALGLALLVGLFFLMGGQDRERVYGDIGRQVNGVKRSSFDQFWGCALQGENVNDIKSNAELETQLGGRGEERGRAYGVHLREQCLPKLEAIGPKLDTLIVPQDLQVDVRTLGQSNARLRSALSAYIAYLDDPDLDYDPDRARPLLQEIAKAWYDFKKAHGDLNRVIKAKIE